MEDRNGRPSSPKGRDLGLAPPVITGEVSLFGKPEPAPRTQESRETGPAGHYRAVVGAPRVRELQLSGDVPVQNRSLELWDHSPRRQRKRVLDTEVVAGSSKVPHASTASFHLPSLKTKMNLNVLISFLCLRPSLPWLQQNQIIQALRLTHWATLSWPFGSWFKNY